MSQLHLLIRIVINTYLRGRISTANHLVLTSSDQLLFILELYFSFFYKTTYLNEEVNCTKPFPLVRVPRYRYKHSILIHKNILGRKPLQEGKAH